MVRIMQKIQQKSSFFVSSKDIKILVIFLGTRQIPETGKLGMLLKNRPGFREKIGITVRKFA